MSSFIKGFSEYKRLSKQLNVIQAPTPPISGALNYDSPNVDRQIRLGKKRLILASGRKIEVV